MVGTRTQRMTNAYGNTAYVVHKFFSAEEVAYIYSNYRTMSFGAIGAHLKRSRNSVASFCRRHQLVKTEKNNG